MTCLFRFSAALAVVFPRTILIMPAISHAFRESKVCLKAVLVCSNADFFERLNIRFV